jgi:hypothetical protein
VEEISRICRKEFYSRSSSPQGCLNVICIGDLTSSASNSSTETSVSLNLEDGNL